MINSIIYAVIMMLVPLIVRSGMNSWSKASITAGLKSIGRGVFTPQSALIALTAFLLSYSGLLSEYSYLVFLILLFVSTPPGAKSAD
ncbi:MAG: hypothetical protein K2H98_08550 [Duncaniella sp.]|nr:hypothetical protein [Duncaniella sp.]